MSQEAVNFWAEGNLANPLSDREKELRDQFVQQYLFDFDARAAALRMGFIAGVATEYGLMLLNDSYVQKKLADAQRAATEDPKSEDEETKRRIRASLLREANYRGLGSSHSARVSALSKLSAFYGMDAPTRSKIDHTLSGGVMAVPCIANIDEWQRAATESQQRLQDDTTTG